MEAIRTGCPMRHPDNGNCQPAGGFCTAVNNQICQALHSAYDLGGFDLHKRLSKREGDRLTLEDLRQMDGQPVWTEKSGHESRWALVYCFHRAEGVIFLLFNNGKQEHAQFLLDEGWKIYRRAPERFTAKADAWFEEMWRQLTDIPMNPETECMEAPFYHWPSGTPREDIWRWFDERHSKGVAYLLYG